MRNDAEFGKRAFKRGRLQAPFIKKRREGDHGAGKEKKFDRTETQSFGALTLIHQKNAIKREIKRGGRASEFRKKKQGKGSRAP